MVYSAACGCSYDSLSNSVRYSSFVLAAARIPDDLVAASPKFLYVCFDVLRTIGTVGLSKLVIGCLESLVSITHNCNVWLVGLWYCRLDVA